MISESELHPILTSFPMVKRMATIGADQGLLLASLSHMMRTTIMSVETNSSSVDLGNDAMSKALN